MGIKENLLYLESSAKMVRDKIKRLEELKSSSYSHILKSYKKRDVFLLEKSLKTAKDIIQEQTSLYNEFNKWLQKSYSNFKIRIRSHNLWNYINAYLGFGIYAGFEGIINNYSLLENVLEQQVKTLNKMENIDMFFQLKQGLNDLYLEELAYIQDSRELINSKELKKFKDSIDKKLNQSKDKDESEDLLFARAFISTLEAFHKDVIWFKAVQKKAREVDDYLEERVKSGSSASKTAAWIALTTANKISGRF